MKDTSNLSHPDSNNINRYVLGTRIQKGPKAHKKNSCKFHDLGLATQGSTIKSMIQEYLQLVNIANY